MSKRVTMLLFFCFLLTITLNARTVKLFTTIGTSAGDVQGTNLEMGIEIQLFGNLSLEMVDSLQINPLQTAYFRYEYHYGDTFSWPYVFGHTSMSMSGLNLRYPFAPDRRFSPFIRGGAHLSVMKERESHAISGKASFYAEEICSYAIAWTLGGGIDIRIGSHWDLVLGVSGYYAYFGQFFEKQRAFWATFSTGLKLRL